MFFLQLADAADVDMNVLPWSCRRRFFPGRGRSTSTFTAHVAATGYAGPWSLEVFNDVVRQVDPRRAARDARRSLLALGEAVGAARG